MRGELGLGIGLGMLARKAGAGLPAWAHFDAASYLGVVADGGTIATEWTDQSGNGRHATSPTGSPIWRASIADFNNLPAVELGASKRFADSIGNPNVRTITAFIVGRSLTTSAGTSRPLLGNGTAWYLNHITNLTNSSNFTFDYGPGNSGSIQGSTNETAPWVVTIQTDDPSGALLRYNGTELWSGAVVGDVLTSMTIGTGTNSFNGQLAEIKIFNRALSLAEIQSEEAILMTKFDLP